MTEPQVVSQRLLDWVAVFHKTAEGPAMLLAILLSGLYDSIEADGTPAYETRAEAFMILAALLHPDEPPRFG